MDHIKNARNFGELPGADLRAEGVNPLCGDTFTVYVKVESERIRQASFECACCGISMASASVMTGLVLDRTLEEASALVREFKQMVRRPDEVDDAKLDTDRRAILSVVRASPSRGNCAVLAWHTLDAALHGADSAVLGGEGEQ
jgi:nitrogen fixation protein NifU and related proteins